MCKVRVRQPREGEAQLKSGMDQGQEARAGNPDQGSSKPVHDVIGEDEFAQGSSINEDAQRGMPGPGGHPGAGEGGTGPRPAQCWYAQ